MIKSFLKKIKRILKNIRNEARAIFDEAEISYKNINFKMHIPNIGDFKQSVELYGCYEPLMMDKAIEIIKPGDMIFDIGCAYGYFTMFAEKLNKDASKIYSFDYLAALVRDFNRNNKKYLNNKAHSIKAYISDKNSKKEITIDSFTEKNNIKNISVLKMDIEGGEIKALEGMLKALRAGIINHLLIEIHPWKIEQIEKGRLDSFRKILNEINYNIELCQNHRGEHRGKVVPWQKVSAKELMEFCYKKLKAGNNNFAVHLYKL